MNELKQFALFAEVVRAGSLSAAARHLGISTSAVSQQLRALEQAHGVTLLHRSTRKLTLTDAGQRFATHCRELVEAAARARGQLELARDALEGELRLSAPVGFARHVASALAPLLERHPGLRMHLQVDDALIDLIEARIDLALRGGRLPDSAWVAQRLCTALYVLCAAPAYLARAGVPQHPDELPAHEWLDVLRAGEGMSLRLSGPAGEVRSLTLAPRITSNNQLSLHQLCSAGLGLAVCVRADIDDEVRSGRLVPVLPEWQVPGGAIWAVTPQRDGQPAKVRHAIEALRSWLRGVPGLVDR